MRRCIFLIFCVFFALASCSPKVYSGVQEVRAFESTALSDSATLRRLVDERMEAYFERTMKKASELRQEIVRERLSDPDSSGRQYVLERSTTRSTARSSSVASSVSSRQEQIIQQTDSVAVRDSAVVAAVNEKRETVVKGNRAWPWYAYVAGLLVAVVIGFVMGLRGRKWRALQCK